jgi:hypothetical protein
MRTFRALAGIFCAMTALNACAGYSSNVPPSKGLKEDTRAAVSSQDWKIIQTAMPAFRSKRLDWASYQIQVTEEDDYYVVEFYQPGVERPRYISALPEHAGEPQQEIYVGTYDDTKNDIAVFERKNDLHIVGVLDARYSK